MKTGKNELLFFKNIGFNYDYFYFNKNEFRPPVTHPDNKKGDIVLFGCSYAYGFGLSQEETFSYLLADYTKRNVYNLAMNGASMGNILYILRNDRILDDFVPEKNNVEYVIYTYIDDHKARNFKADRPRVPRFKNIGNQKLIYQRYNVFQSSELVNSVIKILYHKNFFKNANSLRDLYIREIYKEVKSKFPNAKFVVLVYEKFEDFDFNEDGVIVLDAQDLTKLNLRDEQYTVFDGLHPSGKSWRIIVPILAEKLGL